MSAPCPACQHPRCREPAHAQGVVKGGMQYSLGVLVSSLAPIAKVSALSLSTMTDNTTGQPLKGGRAPVAMIAERAGLSHRATRDGLAGLEAHRYLRIRHTGTRAAFFAKQTGGSAYNGYTTQLPACRNADHADPPLNVLPVRVPDYLPAFTRIIFVDDVLDLCWRDRLVAWSLAVGREASARQLAEVTGLDRHTVTRALHRLAGYGVVRCTSTGRWQVIAS